MDVIRAGQGGPTNFETTSRGITDTQIKELDKTTKAINIIQENNGSISEEEVKKALEKLNKFLDDKGTYAEYQFHDTFKHDLMIKIVDKDTKEVIQEFPPKKILDMVANMMEMVGVLIDKKV